MRVKRLTIERLIKVRACNQARQTFKRLFPKGTVFIEKDIQKILRLVRRKNYSYEVRSWCRWAAWQNIVKPDNEFKLLYWACGYERVLRSFAKLWRKQNRIRSK